jgi:hypothetical protein
LGIHGVLYLSLRSTNPIENLNGTVAHHIRNVKRWRDGQMLLGWVGAALLQAAGRFRRVRGMRDMPKLCAALDRHRSAHPLNRKRKVAQHANFGGRYRSFFQDPAGYRLF